MKRGIFVLFVALAVGLCGFALMRSHTHTEAPGSIRPLLEAMPELAWLGEELKLTDEQFEKVSKLHASYRPKCVEMCNRIAEAHKRMDKAAYGASEVTPELEAEVAEHAKIHAECQRSMLDHLYRTAALLNEEQAKRYLEEMLPFALDYSHSEPKSSRAH